MSAAAVLVIGAGVDALACGLVLARAGHRVLALEQHPPGGEHESGWVPPPLVEALALDEHGLEIELPDPWAAAPLDGGGRLELWQDMGRTVEAIRRVSPVDAAKWPLFCARMGQCARLLAALYTAAPPAPMSREPRELLRMAVMGLRTRRMGGDVIAEFLRVAAMPVADLLDDWFEADALKAVLGAAGVMHLAQGPRSGGTGFGLLHHHVGCREGVFRPARSNVGRLLERLPGIAIRPGARVARIVVRGGRAAGVVLAGGEEISAARVVSAADPRRTLTALLDQGWLDPELARAARHVRARGVAARVELTLERPPGFSALTVAPSLDFIERAHDDAKHGRVSREPWLEARAAAVEGGRHRVDLHVQYVPYTLADGDWDGARASALGELAVSVLARHVPGVAEAIVGRRVFSPRDLEEMFGYPQGQAYHAELALDQALWMRPAPGIAHYRTPVAGLYLCGPGTHPGAGIAGASGINAAHAILEDLR